MDRRAGLALTVAIALAGCGAAAVAGARVVGRGTLGYAVAYGDDALCTIELELRFALVVRDPVTGAVRARHDLGPAERDLPALAVADGVAWVGGADRQVRGLDLATGRVVATWPHGADVTALAIAGGHLAIADATGAVCLRRRADGALLQCAVIADGPLRALALDGATLVASDDGGAVALSVPGLVARARATPPSTIRGREVVLDGRVVARFAGPARAVARGPGGRAAAVGWIRELGDPSVVLLAAPVRRH